MTIDDEPTFYTLEEPANKSFTSYVCPHCVTKIYCQRGFYQKSEAINEHMERCHPEKLAELNS